MKTSVLLSFVLIIALLPTKAFTQQADQQFRFFGFVKYDALYDSREMVAARQGQFSLYPSSKSFNANGKDINGNPNFHMLAIQTRLGVAVTGPDAFGATSRGFIEGAFFGNIESDINGFRLRHAFVELNWDGRHKLMMGQFWHPMFAERAVPGVVAFNTGAPFKPFARNPQIRYTFTEGGTSLILAALSQIDFASQGGTHGLRRSGVPNFHAQIQQQSGNLITGLGADFKVLRPMVATGEETISSLAFTAFGNYSSGDFRMMTQATWGENLFDHLMLGGFAVHQTGNSYSLENIRSGSAWIDLSYGKQTKAGLFGGYAQNFGASSDITLTALNYRGSNIEHIWRIAPRLEWNSGPVRLSTEIEISAAGYGTPDSKGVVKNVEPIQNYRFLFAAWYFF